ncbi:MAG: helix-turn-helix transcriptional regulator [Bacteroidota bacterium]|nr:helix-turn-helix transcriptional regulator [Bacteroidota bacterium]
MLKPRKKPVHPYHVELGLQIRKLRLKKDITLETLGGDVGLDASNLQKIEMGHNITLNTLLKLCICLETTPAKLFSKIDWDLSEKDIEALTTPRPIKKKAAKKKRKK